VSWLIAGFVFATLQVLISWLLGGSREAQVVFGNAALFAAVLAPPIAIWSRRRDWSGCQLVFWATIGLGSLMWAVGQVGWIYREVVLKVPLPWLGWHAVFNLAGSIAPLLALRARPDRGPRPADAATVALDIAGLAVIALYLYVYFIIGPPLATENVDAPPAALLQWSLAQRSLLLASMVGTAILVRRTAWGGTFLKLAAATAVGFVGRSLLNAAVAQGTYYSGSVFDLTWILPNFLYAWAAATAPASPARRALEVPVHASSSAPWLTFAVVGAVPIIEMSVRRFAPMGPPIDGLREVTSFVAAMVLIAMLSARIGVERAERRRTDARLRLMAAAVQETDDLTMILRGDGLFEYANAAFCRVHGYTLDELRTLPPESLVAPDSRDAYSVLTARARGRTPARGTLARVRRDGSTFTVAVTLVPLVDERGGLTHIVSLERDITEELRLRDQMIHSERLSAVGQLVSGVAHEINNPLQTIVGWTELMIATEKDAEARGDLQRIFTEANRAGKIVRNLLSFVRRSPTERTRADLNEVVTSTLSLRGYEIRVAGIDVAEIYGEGLSPVFVNREEIRQVILNLILNAEHAMTSAGAGGRLTVRTGSDEGMVFVEVEDEGPGVPASLAGRIFEPFFTTKEVGQGTGLGLSIAMGIASSHGGRLQLVTTGRRGASFRLTLPPAETPAEARPADPVTALAAPGRRALVVDDETGVRDQLSRLLERRGYVVDTAGDGRAALDLAAAHEYALLLCDVRMPGTRGVEIFERLGTLAPTLQGRFVFITGDGPAEEVATLTQDRGVPLLRKPFASADLEAVLRRIDGRRL
jgi:PAS domain S-box-containing protein